MANIGDWLRNNKAPSDLGRIISNVSNRYNPYDRDFWTGPRNRVQGNDGGWINTKTLGRENNNNSIFSRFAPPAANRTQPSNYVLPAVGDTARQIGGIAETFTSHIPQKTFQGIQTSIRDKKPLGQSIVSAVGEQTPLEKAGLNLKDVQQVPQEWLKGAVRPIYNTGSLVEKTNPLNQLLPQGTKDRRADIEAKTRAFLAKDKDANKIAQILGDVSEGLTTAAAYQAAIGTGGVVGAGVPTTALPTIGKFAPAAGRIAGMVTAGQATMDPEGNRPARALTDIAIGTLFEGVASIFNKINIQIKTGKVDAEARQILGVKKNATPKEIKNAYNAAVKQYHPDLNGDPIKFQQVKIARDIINGNISPAEGNKLIADLMVTRPTTTPTATPTPTPQAGPLALKQPTQGITPQVAPQAVTPAIQNVGQNILPQPTQSLQLTTPQPTTPITPAQAIRIYKKTGDAVEFTNVIKSRKGPIKVAPDYVATKTTPSGNKVPAIREGSGIYANKEIETAPIRDFFSVTMGPRDMATTQDQWVRGEPFGAVYKYMHEPTQKFVAAGKVWNTKQASAAKDIAKTNNVKITKTNGDILSDIIETAGQDLKNLTANAVIKKYGFDKLGYGNDLINTAKGYQGHFDAIRVEDNVIRAKMGKPPVKYIENYIPWSQKVGFWNKMVSESLDTKVSDNLDFIIPNENANPHAMTRLSKEAPNERNLFKLMDMYIDAASKDIHITPAIENIKVHNEVLKGRGLTNTGRYWDRFIREGLAGKQSAFDSSLHIKSGGKAQLVLKKIQDIRVNAGLVGNFVWQVYTQPSSYLTLTTKETGPSAVTGALDWFTDKELASKLSKSTAMQIKSARESSIAFRGQESFKRGVWSGKIDKANDVLAAIMTFEEHHLQGASMAAGMREGKKLGYEGEDLERFTNWVGERTQSMYNRESRPLILNSDIGRALSPFQSFSIEVMNHIKELTGKGVAEAPLKNRFKRALYLMAGIYVANKFSEEGRGRPVFTVGTAIPFVGQFVDDQIESATGKKYRQSNLPIAPLQDIKDMSDAVKDFIEHGTVTKLRKLAVSYGTAAVGLGGGATYNRLIDGIIANSQGYQETAGGNVAFPVEGTVDQIKSLFSGPYSTSEGKKYIEGETSYLGENDSAAFKAGDRDVYDTVQLQKQTNKRTKELNAEPNFLQSLFGGGKEGKDAGVRDKYGLEKTADGGFRYQKEDGTYTTSKNEEDARVAAHKKVFKDSGQSSERFEDTIYYMEGGDVKTTDAIKYDIAVDTASFQKDKQTLERSDNWGGLVELYTKRNEQLRSQIPKLDKFVDAAEITRLENYIDDNLLSLAKLKAGEYTGQKGGSGSKKRSLSVGGRIGSTKATAGQEKVSLKFQGLGGQGGKTKAPKKRIGRL